MAEADGGGEEEETCYKLIAPKPRGCELFQRGWFEGGAGGGPRVEQGWFEGGTDGIAEAAFASQNGSLAFDQSPKRPVQWRQVGDGILRKIEKK